MMRKKIRQIILFFLMVAAIVSCTSPTVSEDTIQRLRLVQTEESIEIFIDGKEDPILIHHVQPDFRPYIHPLNMPGTDKSLTQYSPGHHPHQTGLYWGFTRVNGTGATADELNQWFYKKDKPKEIAEKIGRDFFHYPDKEHWKRKEVKILSQTDSLVRWEFVYDMLGRTGEPILQETQTWSISAKNSKYYLSLQWKGAALWEDVTLNEFDYGSLFLRMPWSEGVPAEAINAARQKNEKAEGQKAMWLDVGMEINGAEEWGHIAIFDHKNNPGFPQTWRVDDQFGIGPALTREHPIEIKKGDEIIFQFQIMAYGGAFNDVALDQEWADYVGDHGMYNTAVLWDIAQKEGFEAKFLTPEEAVENMTIKNGYAVNVFAAEPDITQPMAFCWDDRGRMWIAENRDYEARSHGYSNSGDSRILILEDNDHDGTVDTVKVFLEGIPFPSALAVGFGGVFIGAPPHLLFVPNEKDTATTEEVRILLTGWGIRDRHETINSLHWGPDGWLYGLEGFATPSKIRKPDQNTRLLSHKEEFPENILEGEGTYIDGGVWRYHPVKDRFEVVAHGFSNPWGIDYNEKGELFITACVIPHMFHIMPGGYYHRQGGRHINPYVYEDIKTIVDHRHRSAHGGARFYLSDAFSAEEHGRLFMCNIHDHGVLSDILTPDGSGFKASHGDDFMMANNAQFVGFSTEIGPAGDLFVLDWHDADICGVSVQNKNTGRVFRIAPENSRAEMWEGRFDDLNLKSDSELAELQRSKSDWHARRARTILQYRTTQRSLEKEATSGLNSMLYNKENPDIRLRALWTLYITNELTTAKMLDLLKDSDEYVRAWTIQFLTEDGQPDKETLNRLNQIARKEKSPVVRRFLAGALQRIDNSERWSILESLVRYSEDAGDINIPLMLWFGLEPLVMEDPGKALALSQNSKIPSLSQKTARRLIDGGETEQLIAAIGGKTGYQADLLTGMLAGIENNPDMKEPAGWKAAAEKLRKNPTLAPLGIQISNHFGDLENTRKIVSLVQESTTENNVTAKINAIKILASRKDSDLLRFLPKLMEEKDRGVRMEAIRALAAYNHSETAEFLYKKLPDLSDDEKESAIVSLASRSSYAQLILSGLKDGTLQKSDIPAHSVLQLRAVLGNGFVEVWGPIDDISQKLQQEYQKYNSLLTGEALQRANPVKGKEIFGKLCSACHKMYGEGGEIGPDLTGSNRSNTDYLLSNILDPSGDVQDDYKLVIITTQDGRTLSGNIIHETETHLTLRVIGQDPVIIHKSTILHRDISEKSMMPEGLLNHLSDQEVLDLIAFLKKPEPI